MTTTHESARAAYEAVPTPVDASGVNAAQLELKAIFVRRGSYGCEEHHYVAAMRRVSALIYS